MSFNLRDYRRFGIELLQENGFQVEVWDLTSILYLKLEQNYSPPDPFSYDGLHIFKDSQEIYDRLSNLSGSDFAINLLYYSFESLGFYKALSNSSAKYAVLISDALPEPVIEKRWLGLLEAKLREIAGFRRPKAWKHLLMKLPARYLGVKPASLIIAGGNRCFNYRLPLDKNSEILWAHAFDYDLYLKEKNTTFTEKPMAVFLDDFLPFHPETILEKGMVTIGPDRYYQLLNNFFELIEDKTGLEVVIAAHPRSNYEDRPDYFRGRRHIRGNTVNLVKECRLVLNHCSVAVNLANLFYKPLIFITCSDLDRTYIHYWTRAMAEWHGKNAILIDKNSIFNLEEELTVSKAHYDNYKQAYIKIKHSEDLPFWQIVANRLKKYF